MTDLAAKKLEIAGSLSPAIVPVDVTSQNLTDVVKRDTDGWGVDIVFEATGSPHAAKIRVRAIVPRRVRRDDWRTIRPHPI